MPGSFFRAFTHDLEFAGGGAVLAAVPQGGGGNVLVALGQFQGHVAELPAESACPVLGYFREVMQHDAQAQIPVDGGAVEVGAADEADAAVPKQEAVGLPVQIAGGQGRRVEGFQSMSS